LKAFGVGFELSPRQPSLNHLLCMQNQTLCQGGLGVSSFYFCGKCQMHLLQFPMCLGISSLHILFDIVIRKVP
jgi:hypothetical protein